MSHSDLPLKVQRSLPVNRVQGGSAGTPRPTLSSSAAGRRGSVLIIVIWICFGLVALTLYFANSMSSELRAADNRLDAAAAHQALLGGIRYVEHSLALYGSSGTPPLATDYKAEALPVGDAYFWIIGRDDNENLTQDPFFGLVDESSKLNLNTASQAMLERLPTMSSSLAAAIVSWRRSATSTTSASTGVDDNTYARLDPPRQAKHALFESVDELRLVYGATLDLLFGEDTNRNGVLDPNEDDSDRTAPRDDQNGQLNPGLLEYVTVYSQLSTTRSDGSRRINVSTLSTPTGRAALFTLLRQKFGAERAATILQAIGAAPLGSVAEFYVTSRMTAEEFVQIHTALTALSSRGLVNINTASETVLSCLPGLDSNKAATIVAYRLAHPDALTSLAWLSQVIDRPSFVRVGPYITDQSYQFSADIAAVARSGRGYCRQKVVFDLSQGTPRMIYRQDLTACGWALGTNVRQTLRAAKDTWQ